MEIVYHWICYNFAVELCVQQRYFSKKRTHEPKRYFGGDEQLMARRRKSKARQTQELIQGAITFVLLGTFYLSYQTTHSLNAAVVMTGVVLGLGISAMIYMALARKERLKRSGIAEIDTMDGFLFEKYLGHLFRSQGYDVIVTKPSGDFGADLVIKKKWAKDRCSSKAI